MGSDALLATISEDLVKTLLVRALVPMLGGVVLPSCALANSLVPPVENPLGLDGEGSC